MFIERIYVINFSINVVVVDCFLDVIGEVKEIDEMFCKMNWEERDELVVIKLFLGVLFIVKELFVVIGFFNSGGFVVC